MAQQVLESLAKSQRWPDLEREWLAVLEKPDVDPAPLLTVVDQVVKAGQGKLADTLGWAWLTSVKDSHSPQDVLQLGRQLLVHLSDGNELREEILTLYRKTHEDSPDLEKWIERSGLKSGKSVRRALRFLDCGLQLAVGKALLHRSDDTAAQITQLDVDADSATIRTARREQTLDIPRLIDEYDVVDENDFRVLEQLQPDKIGQLLENDPAAIVVGVLRSHRNKVNRDQLKLILSPRYIPTAAWTDWWNKFKNAVKKSPNLRIEGRSPIFVIYDPVGRTPEDELWAAFSKATTPREWLELLEGYLRESKRSKPNPGMIDRVQSALVGHIDRFLRHKEPSQAFATALVIERVAADGLPVSTDAHGKALEMLKQVAKPAQMVAAVPDARLWSLAVDCVEQAFPEKWPEFFAELLLSAPAAQCDYLAKKIEKAGRSELLQLPVQEALADPGRFTDLVMWLWKGPSIDTPLPVPPVIELLGLILTLVGPARMSEGKTAGQTVNEMRAKIRAGLSSREYVRFCDCLGTLDDSMAQAVRRQIERAEGLGPSVQEDMSNLLRGRFGHLYVKPKVAMWDDESVLYFTARGMKVKEDELAELVNVKMRANAIAIGEAASHGDLSENSEYKFALEERDLLRARVGKLNRELSMAKVLEPYDIPSDHVSIGQKIKLQPAGGGPVVQISILGADESDFAQKTYSYQSPLARLLLGKRLGEMVSVALDDDVVEYRIERVESALT